MAPLKLSEHQPPAERLDELLIRYWDGTLSAAELAELNAVLRADAAARGRLRELSLELTVLTDRFADERSAELDSEPAKSAEPVECSARAARRRGRVLKFAALAAVLAAVLAVAAIWWPTPPLPSRVEPVVAVAWLGEFTGTVTVEQSGADSNGADSSGADSNGADSSEVGLAEGRAIPAGATVRTAGVDASAEVIFADGTRLTLTGNTAVTVSGDEPKIVRVRAGNLAADVKPQPPGRPMRVQTPEAEIEVLGTRFALSAAGDRTVVGVATGSVRVTRLADGKARTVSQGSEAVAEPASELKPTRLPPAPDEVMVSFEGGLPPRWGLGQFTTDDLPMGSLGAVRALRKTDAKGRLHHQVVSQNLWTRGLASLHPDTWLHVRLRVERPGPLDVLMVARDPDLKRRRVSVIFAPKAGKLEPGVWHTLSFPVAQFQRPGSRLPPEFPLMAFEVIVDTLDRDRGLVVERFWFTRGPLLPEMDLGPAEGC